MPLLLPPFSHSIVDEDFYNQSKAENKARTFYRSCLDKNGTIEKLGAKPMLNVLKDVRKMIKYHITNDDGVNFVCKLCLLSSINIE